MQHTEGARGDADAQLLVMPQPLREQQQERTKGWTVDTVFLNPFVQDTVPNITSSMDSSYMSGVSQELVPEIGLVRVWWYLPRQVGAG